MIRRVISIISVLMVFILLSMTSAVEKSIIGKKNKQQAVSEAAKNNKTPPYMVYIPAGKFLMGCNIEIDADCYDHEKPGRMVYLDSYYIDKTELTIEQYQKCVDAGGCKEPHWDDGTCMIYNKHINHWEKGVLPKYYRGPKHPVVCVTWSQANLYCKWAGKRLPTEAEWEKAARGTDGRKYPWGNQKPSCKYTIMDDGGNGCGKYSTWPVCSKKLGNSPYGLCDTAGNVWEWVADRHVVDYYSKSTRKNPRGPKTGRGRVLRGGYLAGISVMLRVSYRNAYHPDERIDYNGFRCACSVSK